MMSYDCVVIGAGVAGLTASLVLAKNGMRVALVEKAPMTGPVIRGFTRKGVHFDTGFHYTGGLDDGEPLDLFLRYLRLRDKVEEISFDPEGFDIFDLPNDGVEFRFPYGYDRIGQALKELFPDERPAIDAYLGAVRRIYESLPYINIDAQLRQQAMTDSARTTSLRAFLDSLTGNILLRSILSMHCLLHGTGPEDVSFAMHAYVVGGYFHSVKRLRGGGRSLAQAFDDSLSESGVDVITARGAQAIMFSDSTDLKGVRLDDGERLSAERCIVTVHPGQFVQLLPDHAIRPAYRKRLMDFGDSMSAYVLYGISTAATDKLAGHNYFLFTEPECLGLDPTVPFGSRPVYLAAAGEDDQRNHAFMALCPAALSEVAEWQESKTGSRPESYNSHKRWIADRLLERIAQRLPELCDGASFLECATPLTFRDFANSPSGGLYGIKHKVDQYDPIPVTRVKQLFLAGQATAAPGVLGAMVSAFLACGTILGHDYLRDELRKYR